MTKLMKNILVKTPVQGNFLEVMERFDLDLFTALLPKGNMVSIVSFTGSQKGDFVHLKFKLPGAPEWISDIVADGNTHDQAFFIDEGRVIPFGIKYWKHKHIVKKIDEHNSMIVDDIYFSTNNVVLNNLMYPFLYLSFLARKKIYKKYFDKG